MATTSVNIYVVDAVTAASKQFAVSFTLGYLSRDHVTAYVEGEVDGSGDQIFRTLTWINDGLVELSGTLTVGQTVRVQRTTPAEFLIHDFQAGAVLRERNLDEAHLQALMILHEVFDGRNINEFVDDINMNLHDILNAGTINTSALFVGGLPITADNAASIPIETETQALSDGQLSVVFVNPTVLATFYLSGPEVDNGRLLANTDYTVDHESNTVTLNQSYPAGTQLLMAYFGGDGAPETTGSIRVYSTKAELVVSSLNAGVRAVTAGFYAVNDKGGADYVIQTAAEYGGAVKVGDWVLANGNIAVLQHNGIVNVRQFGAFHDQQAIDDKSLATDQSAYFEAASIYAENLQIVVSAGGYKVDSATTGKAFWLVEPGAEVRKTGTDTGRVGSYRDLSNLTGAVRQWANRPLGGTGTALDGGSGYRLGDPEPYESNVIGHSATASLAGIGRNGQAGLFGAGRSSQNDDPPATTVMQVANEFYGIQDNTANTSNVMTTMYSEVIRFPGTGTCFNQEVTAKNFGPTAVVVTALSPPSQSAGAVANVQYITGVGPATGSGSVDLTDWPTATPTAVSYCIGLVGEEGEPTKPGWDKGIIFFKGSIVGADTPAIEMYRDFGITWRADGGAVEARVENDRHLTSYGNSVVQTESAVHQFWRFRGPSTARTNTIAGDYLGQTTYHGHPNNTGGFASALNPSVSLRGVQDGAVSGSNAQGRYELRVNDGAGAFSGFDLIATGWRPTGDGVMDIGKAANRCNTIYAAVGTINTSDRRMKQDEEVLSAAELAVAVAVKGLIKKYRLKSDPSNIRVGVIAQELETAFAAEGLVATDYGLLDYDAESDRYGVNYNELLCFCIAAL